MINTITHAEFPHGDLGGWGADRSAPSTDPPVREILSLSYRRTRN
jgi:hypothetical protein